MKTFLDWSAYDTYGIGDAYSGIPATGGNYAKAVAVCMHSRDCQKTAKGVMCPSYRITGDRKHSTEARVAAFKAALNDGDGDASAVRTEPERRRSFLFERVFFTRTGISFARKHSKSAFADPRLDEAMDLCVSCKACKKECPSAVDMTLIKTEYLAQRHEVKGVPLRTRLFGGVPEWAGRHRPLLRLAIRLRNRLWPIARLAEKTLGISARRVIPEPAPQAFSHNAPMSEAAAARGEVILFVDTFCHHFDPHIAEAALEVLERAGYRVRIARPAPTDAEPDRPLCCGRTYLTTGMVEKARGEAKRVLEAFRGEIAAKTPIVGLEPSCLLSLRDELYSLGLGPEIGDLGKQLYLFEEFLSREHQNNGLRLDLKPSNLPKALVHGHCHQKAFGAMKATRKVLSWIPGFAYEVVETSCCGMAGSFGLEAEHFEASMQMAELALLPAVRAAAEDAPLIANGFSCRHQIEHGSGRKARHIALVLRDALAGVAP
ncbi:(Fe-S)-binding protein [Methylocystis heyeri]|uniref:(Fe-S)-binding protein n=1 Tax=Methylocystis heyeri TaxID=391905 RepID=A0A6B8KGR4_9HYPH|nr:4Fe-4S dicluster domain-containing protein [Methylocystis heyeri]QGM46809.1 (Fe-S)-binding protein [Methylocystis heyeri]